MVLAGKREKNTELFVQAARLVIGIKTKNTILCKVKR